MLKVLVVNKDGFPLMPTIPRKARKLLETGRAKIYARRPFTIQLIYGCRGYTQPITLGIDAGYQTIGYSVVTEKEELVGGQFKLLEGMSERLTERRKYRRNRHNRLRQGFLQGWEPKLKSFKAETFMTTVYRKLVEALNAERTFGYITEVDREALELPKTHHNDAFVIAGGTNQARCQPLNLEQTRRNRRSLEQFYDAKYIDTRTGEKATGSTLFSGRRTRNKNLNSENLRVYRGQKLNQGRRSIRKSRYPYQPNDLVVFEGRVYRVRGLQNLGTRAALYADKNLTVDVKKIPPYLWRKGICEQLTL